MCVFGFLIQSCVFVRRGQCSGDMESELSYWVPPSGSEYTAWERILEGGRGLRLCIRISCNQWIP